MSKEEDIITCKICLLGESSVGCDSIKRRYIDNIFNEPNIAILGLDKKNKIEWLDEENQSIKFEIWNGP